MSARKLKAVSGGFSAAPPAGAHTAAQRERTQGLLNKPEVVRTSLDLDMALHKRLRFQSVHEGRTGVEIVRDALLAYLDANKP